MSSNAYYIKGIKHTCPICNTEFQIPYGAVRTWTYRYREKNTYKYPCSYTCYQKAIRKKKEEKSVS